MSCYTFFPNKMRTKPAWMIITQRRRERLINDEHPMVTPEKIEEWIKETIERPESAPLILQYISGRLRDLAERNEELLAENIALTSGKRVEEYERRIAHLEYQLELVKRQLGGELPVGEIEGDINDWFVYADMDLYPEKNFLHDGIYEWINILRLSVAYRFTRAPVRVWVEYSFVHADNYANISGNTVVKNLIGLGLCAWWSPRQASR